MWKKHVRSHQVCSPEFHTLKIHMKHSILILNKLWKNPDGGILRKIKRHDTVRFASDRDVDTNFFCFEMKTPFSGKVGSRNQNCMFNMKYVAYTISNMPNSMRMFIFPILEQK